MPVSGQGVVVGHLAGHGHAGVGDHGAGMLCAAAMAGVRLAAVRQRINLIGDIGWISNLLMGSGQWIAVAIRGSSRRFDRRLDDIRRLQCHRHGNHGMRLAGPVEDQAHAQEQTYQQGRHGVSGLERSSVTLAAARSRPRI